jgi:hypothetical protein
MSDELAQLAAAWPALPERTRAAIRLLAGLNGLGVGDPGSAE